MTKQEARERIAQILDDNGDPESEFFGGLNTLDVLALMTILDLTKWDR